MAIDRHSERCKNCRVRHRAVCETLSDVESQRLNAMARVKFVSPGSVIVGDNSKAEYFATVVTGVVKLTKELADGRQQIIGLLYPSDFVGRPFRSMSPYKAEAVTSVQLCAFDATSFEKLVKENRDFDRRLYQYSMLELDAAQELMLLGRKSAEAKLASFLVTVAKRMGSMSPDINYTALNLEIPLSRNEIANFLGLTIETVSRQFTQLKSEGLIVLKGSRKIVISDLPRLALRSERQN